MRPFTFNPVDPGSSLDQTRWQALADKLPPGPCLFVTDRDLVRLGLTEA